MRFIYGGLLTIVAFCLLSSSALAFSGGGGTGGGNGPGYCAGCGGGSWYWETANLDHYGLRQVAEISLNSTNPDYRPEFGKTDEARKRMKRAAKKVLDKAFINSCGSC